VTSFTGYAPDRWQPLRRVKDHLGGQPLPTAMQAKVADAQADLFECVEVFYNRSRCHSTLGYSSAVRFLENWLGTHAAQHSTAA
jgi:hypothetical protein